MSYQFNPTSASLLRQHIEKANFSHGADKQTTLTILGELTEFCQTAQDTLEFVERWAVHHGTKATNSPSEVLSAIQHYPAIKAITKGYRDGVEPKTFDPYARIAELESQLEAIGAGGVESLRKGSCLMEITEPAATHPDDAAVDALAALMKAKLAKQRAKGYGGWNDKAQCSQQRLSDMLRVHVDKGDPVDVANFCAFLVARGEGIAAAPQAVQAAVQEVLGWVHKAKNGKMSCHFYPYEPHCDSAVRDNGGEKIAVVAAPAHPAEGVPDEFGTAQHWKEKAQYWAGVAHELRGQALRGEPVDGITHPTQQGLLGERVATLWVEESGVLDFEVLPPCTLPAGEYPLHIAAQSKQGGA